jgi:hypothetical protein
MYPGTSVPRGNPLLPPLAPSAASCTNHAAHMYHNRIVLHHFRLCRDILDPNDFQRKLHTGGGTVGLHVKRLCYAEAQESS